MTSILIIGGGGMIGQKLAASLAADGLAGDPTPEVTLFDMQFLPQGAVAAQSITGTLTDAGTATRLAATRPDTVFHLAAIVSGEAEIDFDKGWQVNMLAFWSLLEALRAQHVQSGGTYRPRIVFTSSVAAFGGPYPDKIDDEFLSAPQTSYGAQKVASEMMLGDFSRKGFVDGISIRLPTICVRPGKANKAASSFFSGIIREPLNGVKAILPVSPDVRSWHASPRSAIGFLRHSATLDTARLGGRRALNLPGISVTVQEQIDALRDVAGAKVAGLIRHAPDQAIIRIVDGWPQDFDPARALALGYRADRNFRSIIEAYIADDLPGAAPAP